MKRESRDSIERGMKVNYLTFFSSYDSVLSVNVCKVCIVLDSFVWYVVSIAILAAAISSRTGMLCAAVSPHIFSHLLPSLIIFHPSLSLVLIPSVIEACSHLSIFSSVCCFILFFLFFLKTALFPLLSSLLHTAIFISWKPWHIGPIVRAKMTANHTVPFQFVCIVQSCWFTEMNDEMNQMLLEWKENTSHRQI